MLPGPHLKNAGEFVVAGYAHCSLGQKHENVWITTFPLFSRKYGQVCGS